MYTGPNIVKDGLVLALDATSERSWTPGSALWYDLSGYNNHATAYGSPMTQDANTPVRNIYFDGTNTYFQITANETSLSFKNGQTVCMLFYTTYTSGRRNLWDQAYGGYGTWTHEQGNNISQYFGTHGGNSSPYIGYSSETTPQGEWNYVAMSRTATTATWFRNGVRSSQRDNPYDMTAVNTTANIRIGVGYAGWWIGNLVYVHAYNRGLDDAEIAQNFNALKGRFD